MILSDPLGAIFGKVIIAEFIGDSNDVTFRFSRLEVFGELGRLAIRSRFVGRRRLVGRIGSLAGPETSNRLLVPYAPIENGNRVQVEKMTKFFCLSP